MYLWILYEAKESGVRICYRLGTSYEKGTATETLQAIQSVGED